MPDLAMLDYFYGDEAEQFTFYRIPKVLFTDPSYRRISSDAKILYGLMLDRMGLSVRNGWLDEYNRVFIFFTLEDALEYLCCGHTKAVSLFGELDKAGLIERKKQGQGKPTKIYVKNFVRNAEVLTSEKRKSKVPQSGSQDFQKTASNNTEIKDTELSDTEPSIHPARGLPEDKSPAADAMDTMRVYDCCFYDVYSGCCPGRRRWRMGCGQPHGGLRGRQPCFQKPGCQAAYGGRRHYASRPESGSAAVQPDYRLIGTGSGLCKA